MKLSEKTKHLTKYSSAASLNTKNQSVEGFLGTTWIPYADPTMQSELCFDEDTPIVMKRWNM